MKFDTGATVVRSQESALVTNKLLRNTYSLLAMTLIFSAFTAGLSMAMNFPHMGLLTLVGYFGLLFLTTKYLSSSETISILIGLSVVAALCLIAFSTSIWIDNGSIAFILEASLTSSLKCTLS